MLNLHLQPANLKGLAGHFSMKSINLSICSRCLSHEISSWVTEKSGFLSPEIISKIFLELRDIKLKQGECIVCNNSKIAENCVERIIKILEKENQELLKQEFINMFTAGEI